MWLSGVLQTLSKVLLVVLVFVLKLAVTLCALFLSGIHPLGVVVMCSINGAVIELLLGLLWVCVVLVSG